MHLLFDECFVSIHTSGDSGHFLQTNINVERQIIDTFAWFVFPKKCYPRTPTTPTNLSTCHFTQPTHMPKTLNPKTLQP